MHPLVRDLLRRVVYLAEIHPNREQFLARVRAKLAENKNIDINDEFAIRKVVAKGRWELREEGDLINLMKYRALRQRYGSQAADSQFTGYDSNSKR